MKRHPYKYAFIGLLLVFVPCLSSAKAEEVNQQALILQWEVSHSRNTDQTSLIFRSQEVQLVTNHSLWQEGKKVQLGRFKSPLTIHWQAVQKRVERYHKRLKKTVRLLSLIKDERFKPPIDPHAPILRLNGEELAEGQAYFKELADIIYQVWNHPWICIECAQYQKNKNSIVRVVQAQNQTQTQTPQPNTSTGARASKLLSTGVKKQKKTFTLKELHCVSTTRGRHECVDERFGIFEL